MLLAHPFWLLLLILVPLPWVFLRRKGYIGYSDLRLVQGVRKHLFLHKVPIVLYSVAFLFLLLALARPQLPHAQTLRTIRTRDIVVAVDISGSMEITFAGELPKRQVKVPDLDKELPPRPTTNDGQRRNRDGTSEGAKQPRRIDAAEAAVLRYVEYCYAAKTGDRIGIMSFDTSPHWLYPLTDDLKQIWRNGLFISEGLGGGTNFGEIDPGPIDAAAEQFDEMGKSSTRVLIMVTDGEDTLSESTLARLESVIRKRGMHFYVIGVGEELGKQASTAGIYKLGERVGGRNFHAANPQELADCFDSVNRMEKFRVEVESKTYWYQELFPAFLEIGSLFLLFGLVSEALIANL